MNISQVGINLIKSFEGCRLTAYQDISNVWTIGWGHTGNVFSGETISQSQADSMLIEDLGRYVDGVNQSVHVPLNQFQFDALVSLCYNIGVYAFQTSSLVGRLNNGDYTGAGNEFLLWVHSGGNVVQGLVNRRQAELALYNHQSDTPQLQKSFPVLGTVYVNVDELNLRTSPSTQSPIIRTLNKGEAYLYYAVQNGWYNLGGNQWAYGNNGVYLSVEAPRETIQDYTIRSGENLTVISKRFNTSIDNLMNLNPQIKNKNLVYDGQVIKVPHL